MEDLNFIVSFMVMANVLLLPFQMSVLNRFLTLSKMHVPLSFLKPGFHIVKNCFHINLIASMVYIFFYEILPYRYYRICPSVQHALNLVSCYAGDFGYRCEVFPYKPVACKFEDFKSFISGIYGPEYCDITRQDILEFEFQYNVLLQIIDLYE